MTADPDRQRRREDLLASRAARSSWRHRLLARRLAQTAARHEWIRRLRLR